MLKRLKLLYFAAGMMLLITGGSAASAQTSAFTYQGRFTDTTVAQPTSGTYQMQFGLFDNANAAVGSAITVPSVQVVNGIFSVNLDFGAGSFSGAARLLEIRVFNTAASAYVTLAPRQPITSSPYSVRTINANFSDALSTACVGCVDDAKIASVAGSKVTGTVATATTATTASNVEGATNLNNANAIVRRDGSGNFIAGAISATTFNGTLNGSATTAGNVTGTVAIANGGTGSTTKNFVDLTTAQTVSGNKTFSNTVSTNIFSAGSGGVVMNNNFLRLRGSDDNNHGMFWNSTVDGPEFRGNIGFRWTNGTNGATERMRLDGAGNLTVNGTINGTLADNSVGTAQVANGSLRLTDMAFYNILTSGAGGTFGAHGCLQFTLAAGTIPGLAANDVVTFIPPASSPAGFHFQPIYVTGTGSFNYNVCNTLNGNNTLPTQDYRIFVLRP